jgi:GT2 family glycosyltransferase
VIVVSWNAAPVLGRCLESLARNHVDGGFETIVVDNASTDSTADVLRAHADDVRVITNDQNVGFAVGNNQGAAAARAPVLFFLNSDTELLGPDVLERLAEAVEEPTVAIAGPLLVNPDGNLQPSCVAHPNVPVALLIGSGLHRLLPDRLAMRVAPQFWSHDRPSDVGWVDGAAFAIGADLFHELGGWWSSIYGGEENLAYRAQRRGLRVRFELAAKVMHVGNFSLAQRQSESARAARVASAEMRFLRVHYGRWRANAIRVIVGSSYAARVLAHAALGRRERARVFLAMARVYAVDG